MKIRWRELGIAFMMAITLWYGLSGAEKKALTVNLRVDYRGLPPKLTLRSAPVTSLTVWLGASDIRSRSIGSRSYTYTVDLSSVKKGDNNIPISKNSLPFASDVEVFDIFPASIDVVVDSIESKSIPLEVNLLGDIPQSVKIKAEVNPSTVTITGASEVVEQYKELFMPVIVDNSLPEGRTEVEKEIVSPGSGVLVSPNSASVSLDVSVSRKFIELKEKIFHDKDLEDVRITPDIVLISAELPSAIATKNLATKVVNATVNIKDMPPGTYVLPVNVELPPYGQLLSIDPTEVEVIIPPSKPKN